jgi:predicted signal transduction protein with EAL and GGDEF domain
MRHAELALGQAKSAGGRSWCLFDPAMVSEVSLRQELEADLRKALLKGELSLAYQPCGDSSSRAISGFEARPRWDHPVRGLVPASVLMKLAEAGGLIVALGEWALKTACIEAAGWPVSLSSAPLNVVVRVSAHELRSPGHLPGVVQQGLAASGLQPDRLELKIPDTCLQDTTLEVLPILHRLKALGVRIVLAECTIGPSLLSRLKSFPFSAVAFGAGAGTDANGGRLHEALAAVGVDHIGCYLDSSLTSTAGIAEVLQLHASTCNPAAVVG